MQYKYLKTKGCTEIIQQVFHYIQIIIIEYQRTSVSRVLNDDLILPVD